MVVRFASSASHQAVLRLTSVSMIYSTWKSYINYSETLKKPGDSRIMLSLVVFMTKILCSSDKAKLDNSERLQNVENFKESREYCWKKVKYRVYKQSWCSNEIQTRGFVLHELCPMIFTQPAWCACSNWKSCGLSTFSLGMLMNIIQAEWALWEFEKLSSKINVATLCGLIVICHKASNELE